MRKFITEVFDFIKNPKDQRIENWSIGKNVKYIIYVLALDLLINIVLFLPILFLLDAAESIISETRIDYSEMSLGYALLLVGLLVPIIEEIIFRLPLRYNKLFSYFISRNKWDRIFRFLVYSSILFFGFVHGSNYENKSIFFYCVLPLLVGTQLFGGVLFTFIRVRFNLLSSIICHVLWNVIVAFIPVLIGIFEKPYAIENESYSLKIEYLNYGSIENQKFKIDSSSSKIFNVEIIEYSYNHVLDSLFNQKRNLEDHLIHINLKSDKGINKEEFKQLLNEYEKNELD